MSQNIRFQFPPVARIFNVFRKWSQAFLNIFSHLVSKKSRVLKLFSDSSSPSNRKQQRPQKTAPQKSCARRIDIFHYRSLGGAMIRYFNETRAHFSLGTTSPASKMMNTWRFFWTEDVVGLLHHVGRAISTNSTLLPTVVTVLHLLMQKNIGLGGSKQVAGCRLCKTWPRSLLVVKSQIRRIQWDCKKRNDTFSPQFSAIFEFPAVTAQQDPASTGKILTVRFLFAEPDF